MRRHLPIAATALLSALIGVVVGAGGMAWRDSGKARGATVTRLSPDETVLARLVEDGAGSGPDRPFSVHLDSLATRKSARLYHAPDGGDPAGTERLIWSRDGAWLLLVGRHFSVREDLFLDNGDQLFLLHHLPTGRTWVNSPGPDGLPSLEAEMVRPIAFTEPVRLRGE